jgi:hypothetical protein
MDKSERWLGPNEAAQLISKTLGRSIGAALPDLRDALASGKVRVRQNEGSGPRMLPAHLWVDAEFDTDRDVVIAPDEWAFEKGLNHLREYKVEINDGDLNYWLARNHSSVEPKSEDPQASQSALLEGIQDILTHDGKPGHGGAIKWERFCDLVRKRCGKAPKDYGYGDRTIKRKTTAYLNQSTSE